MERRRPEGNLLVAMYNQYWLHGRHIEDGRLKYFASYLVVLGIVIYTLYGHNAFNNVQPLRTVLVGFEIVITLITLLMSIKMEYVINMYMRSVHRLLNSAQIDIERYGKAHYKTPFRNISVSRLFIIFYLLCICLFVNLLIYELCIPYLCPTIFITAFLWLLFSLLIYFNVLFKSIRVPVIDL